MGEWEWGREVGSVGKSGWASEVSGGSGTCCADPGLGLEAFSTYLGDHELSVSKMLDYTVLIHCTFCLVPCQIS